jgi:hypothetical protein
MPEPETPSTDPLKTEGTAEVYLDMEHEVVVLNIGTKEDDGVCLGMKAEDAAQLAVSILHAARDLHRGTHTVEHEPIDKSKAN